MPLRPMLATLEDTPSLTGKGLVYEPKYDGIRGLAEVKRAAGAARARIWSRAGNDKTKQFPTVAKALESADLPESVVLDGEIVALDERGRPAGFQRLQGRMHLLGAQDVARAERDQPVAFSVFDILSEGTKDLTRLPLTERRKHLEARFGRIRPGVMRLSEQVAGDATEMHERAVEEGWEGLIAKDVTSVYQQGRRSPAWRKIKLQKQQEFVVGGWTEPRQTRQYFGALLLGVQDGGLKYV